MQSHPTETKATEPQADLPGTMNTRAEAAALPKKVKKVRFDLEPKIKTYDRFAKILETNTKSPNDSSTATQVASKVREAAKPSILRNRIEEAQSVSSPQSTAADEVTTRPTQADMPIRTDTSEATTAAKTAGTHKRLFLPLREGSPKIAFVNATRVETITLKPIIRIKGSPSPAPGSKPTGIVKRKASPSPSVSVSSTKTKPKPQTKPKKEKEPTLDDALDSARRWLVNPTSYMIRNPQTGCFGLSTTRKPSSSSSSSEGISQRPELTIAHAEACACLDARLLHICEHVDRLLRRPRTTTTTTAKGEKQKQKRQKRRLARRSRDALVLAIKISMCCDLDVPVPEDMRFPLVAMGKGKRIGMKRLRREIEAETKVVNVVERYKQQRLVERWKSLKAYRARTIWMDW